MYLKQFKLLSLTPTKAISYILEFAIYNKVTLKQNIYFFVYPQSVCFLRNLIIYDSNQVYIINSNNQSKLTFYSVYTYISFVLIIIFF